MWRIVGEELCGGYCDTVYTGENSAWEDMYALLDMGYAAYVEFSYDGSEWARW